jgi:hypothetical protein
MLNILPEGIDAEESENNPQTVTASAVTNSGNAFLRRN